MHGRRYRAGNDVGPEPSRHLIDRPTAAPAALTRDEEGLLGCFRTDDPISAEELCELSGLGFGELSALLLGLEMAGAVRQLPGNRYMKLR